MAKWIVGLLLACIIGVPDRAWGEDTEQTLRKMHELNQLVMKAASLAKRRAGRTDVAAYGGRLEMDHRFADHQVLELASELDLDIIRPLEARGTTEERQREGLAGRVAELENLRGPEFDREFIRLMRAVHQHSIDVLSSAQRDAPPGLVRVLDRMIPIFEQHVELAINLAEDAPVRAEAPR